MSANGGRIYCEDIAVGEERWSGEIVVDGAEMVAYSRRNDPWPFHLEPEAARESVFSQGAGGGIVASGGFTVALALRLHHMIVNRPGYRWAFLVGFDWGEVKFPTPVRAGDRLRERIEILAKRPTSKPGRGLINYRIEVFNQEDAAVLSFVCNCLVARQEAGAGHRQ